jgi:flagellar biosynthesis anti-sigma factor FlgM
MRIDPAVPLPDSQQTTQVASSGSSVPPTQPTAISSGQDQAQLSITNDAIQNLKASVLQLPEIRQGQVDALSQAINSGTYQVSTQQLTDAMSSDPLIAQLHLT